MAELTQRLPRELPGLRLLLAEHGYQGTEAWPALEQRLRELRPDLVLVALGVPRQELWIQAQPRPLGGLWMGVGGSFDVWSGNKKGPPAGWGPSTLNGSTA